MDVDVKTMEVIDGLKLSPRAARLLQNYYDSTPGIGTERAALAAQSWAETADQPLALRRAKLLEKVLLGIPVVIFPGQLLVGSETKYCRGCSPQCDYDGTLLGPLLSEQHGQVTLSGPMVKAVATEEEWQQLVESAKWWEGKTPVELVQRTTEEIMGSWYDDLVEAGGTLRYESYPLFPGFLEYEKVIRDGLQSFINVAQQHMKRFKNHEEDDPEKYYTWQAAEIVLRAAIAYAKRYAQCAKDMAVGECDPSRRGDLLEIAEVCTRVPEQPARSFREALQCMILLYLVSKIETPNMSPGSWKLVDQYLYPYLRRDMENGSLTWDGALDLVADFLIFATRLERMLVWDWREFTQKGVYTSLALGGLTKDGHDATNELSYLFLHAIGLVKTPEPHVVVRYHRDTPRWFMLKALQTNCKAVGGVPQFQNTEHVADYLVKQGVSLENARDWCSSGCSQAEPADAPCSFIPSYHNVALAVDLALHSGVASATGKRLGTETGAPGGFETFDELYDAFTKQFEYIARRNIWHMRLTDRLRMKSYKQIFGSALSSTCLDKGMDLNEGGYAHYHAWYLKDRGIIPAADSLLAIKKLVFDEKKLSMPELIKAVDANFTGEKGEKVRQMCLAVPKYGNDINEADDMVRNVAKFTAGILSSEKNVFGVPFAINRNGQAWHFWAGKRLGALPNGRKAREPLPDGSLSPMQGMDTQGPTAVLNSALRADFKESMAAIFTLQFPASLVREERTREKVADLTETFLKHGGSYIQYNVIDRDTLLEARRNPEKYRTLVVRVGGYSAYFVELSPEVQEEIIHRSSQPL